MGRGRLDSLLLAAWNRISDELKRDRLLALKRSRRRLKGVLTRPMREWCLVIRACDTRVRGRAIVEPRDAIERQVEHTLTLDGSLIRKLTKPVLIPWPGVTYEEAARRCGREWKTIKNWIRKGVFAVEYFREHRFPERTRRGKGITWPGGRKSCAPGSDRAKSLGGRPYVWTPSPLDPNNFDGRAPHAVWGTLWQNLWERLPLEYELEVKRVPRFRKFRGRMCFRGWDFVCPGRVDADGKYLGCGRRCTYLYAPQTVWTLARALGEDAGFDMPLPEDGDALGLAGQWHPGVGDPIATRGPRSFACKECWGVYSACMANYHGWNEFVTQISGGLLYGRDVPRPRDVCPVERKKRPYRWRVRRKGVGGLQSAAAGPVAGRTAARAGAARG